MLQQWHEAFSWWWTSSASHNLPPSALDLSASWRYVVSRNEEDGGSQSPRRFRLKANRSKNSPCKEEFECVKHELWETLPFQSCLWCLMQEICKPYNSLDVFWVFTLNKKRWGFLKFLFIILIFIILQYFNINIINITMYIIKITQKSYIWVNHRWIHSQITIKATAK